MDGAMFFVRSGHLRAVHCSFPKRSKPNIMEDRREQKKKKYNISKHEPHVACSGSKAGRFGAFTPQQLQKSLAVRNRTEWEQKEQSLHSYATMQWPTHTSPKAWCAAPGKVVAGLIWVCVFHVFFFFFSFLPSFVPIAPHCLPLAKFQNSFSNNNESD